MRRKLWVLIVLIFSMLCAVNVKADLGDFNDYDSDSGWGDSDWGGNDSWDWDDDDDDNYYSSGGGYSGGGGGGSGTMAAVVWGIIIVIIIVSIVSSRNNKGGGSGSTNVPPSANPENQDHTDEIVREIVKIDPNFSQTKFISWAKEVFITLQNAWSARQFDKCRPFEKEELFRQHQQQIQGYINNGRINVIDRININNAHFFEYKRDNQYEYLTVFMKTRMIDYIKDEKTGQVLKGDPNKDCFPRYLLTFMRKKGVLTDEATSNKSTTNCPNCGAPTQITSSGQCEYCGSVITTGDYDWVLSDIQGVKRNVAYGQGGVSITETPAPEEQQAEVQQDVQQDIQQEVQPEQTYSDDNNDIQE